MLTGAELMTSHMIEAGRMQKNRPNVMACPAHRRTSARLVFAVAGTVVVPRVKARAASTAIQTVNVKGASTALEKSRTNASRKQKNRPNIPTVGDAHWLPSALLAFAVVEDAVVLKGGQLAAQSATTMAIAANVEAVTTSTPTRA